MSQLITQRITPYLWFDHQAKEAAGFYCSVFENSKIISSSDLAVEFELDGMQFMALNGGPRFKFTEAISFVVLCKDQAEVDYYWDSFVSNGGQEDMCSWCKDKYGLSWQVIPVRFLEMMKTGNPDQVKRVFDLMLTMRKLVVEEFEKVF